MDKIVRGGFMLNNEEVDLNQLIKGVVENMDLKIGEFKGELKSTLKANQPIVSADVLHLTNIIHNLLDNAIKYSSEKPKIEISTKDENDHIWLTVADEGIGIAKEHHPKLFNKFYRVPTGNVHNVKGFGLGLYYIKNVCDAHSWKLNLASEPEVGTTITLMIPC